VAMRSCRNRPLLALLLGTAFLLSAAPEVICVHSDGSKAIEDGSERCCPPVRGPAQQMASFTALSSNAGSCPGCTDLLLRSDAQRTRCFSELAAPSPAALASPMPSADKGTAPALIHGFFTGALSPPHVSPLRI